MHMYVFNICILHFSHKISRFGVDTERGVRLGVSVTRQNVVLLEREENQQRRDERCQRNGIADDVQRVYQFSEL